MDTTEVMPKLAPIDLRRARRPHPAGNLVVAIEASTRPYRDFNAVDGINLQVLQGGAYDFLDSNEAGKSTTMKLLLDPAKPTSGGISVLGHPVGTGPPLLAGAIGSLIEGPSYYPNLSGRENLVMLADYLGLLKARIQHALKTVGPANQEPKLVKRYSMDMKQRLGPATALLADPRLILLDEPINGLDPTDVAGIWQLTVALARQERATVIVSSHILPEIGQMTDLVGIICAGRLYYQELLSGLRNEGVVEFTATDPTGVSVLLRAHRIGCQVTDGVIRTPMLPDPLVGDLVIRIVRAGQTLFRVQTVRKNLEQAFLEPTDSLIGREVQW